MPPRIKTKKRHFSLFLHFCVIFSIFEIVKRVIFLILKVFTTKFPLSLQMFKTGAPTIHHQELSVENRMSKTYTKTFLN